MYIDSIFRICLIVSISVHLAFFVPWPFLHFQSKPKVPFQNLELTYFNKAKMPDTPVTKMTPPVMPKLSVLPETKPAAGNVIKPGTSQSAGEKISAKKDEQNPIKEIPVKKEEKPQIAASHTEKKNDNDSVIDIGTQKGVVYEKYYLDVREKIRGIIEKNRKGFLKESEVCVKFIVERNGTLKDLYLYKSSGADAGSLENLAVKSIKEAAPFHPFTDKIKEDELQFNLPIRVIRKD